MAKAIFIKHPTILILREMFDVKYLFYFFVFAFLFASIQTWLAFASSADFSFSFKDGSDYSRIALLIGTQLLVIFFFGLLFRVFTTMVFERSLRMIQRIIAFSLAVFYILFTSYFGYQLENIFSYNFIDIGNIAFIFWFFLIVSYSFYMLKSPSLRMGILGRIFSVITALVCFLLLNWFIAFKFRENTNKFISNSQISFLVYGYVAKQNEFEEIKKQISMGNIGHENKQEISDILKTSSAEILNIGDLGRAPDFALGTQNDVRFFCKDYAKNRFDYQINKYLFPLTLILPNQLVSEFLPNLYCLNVGRDIEKVMLNSVFSFFQRKQGSLKNVVAFVNGNLYRDNLNQVLDSALYLQNHYKDKSVNVRVYFIE